MKEVIYLIVINISPNIQPTLLVYLVFGCALKVKVFENPWKVWGEDENSIFEIEDQTLGIIEVYDMEDFWA